MTMNCKQAVVIGAGIAGLAAAAAISGSFDRVYLVDRDELQTGAAPRQGVPQGLHPHVLMSGGLEALSRLLPGLGDDLQAAGAIPFELGSNLRWEFPGLGAFPRRSFGLNSFSLTRPLLENVVARRLLALPNITPIMRVRSVELVASAHGKRVSGVDFRTYEGESSYLPAHLVVDATGRTSIIKRYFRQRGLALHPSSRLEVGVHYATGTFTLPDHQDFTVLVTSSAAPESSPAGYLLRIGEDRWHALLIGRGDKRPPVDPDAFIAFARELATPTIAEALEGATLVGDIKSFAFRESVRYDFGQSASGSLPVGLLPIGDSLCRLNPAYGQGMSVAGIEAVLLKIALQRMANEADPIAAACLIYMQIAQTLTDLAWQESRLPDLIHPETAGERPSNLGEQWAQRRAAVNEAFWNPDAHRDLFSKQQLLSALDLLGKAAEAPVGF
jgi:2-polyprenyl-6-methoxyphenol hydroxylase-like FAD-dependent oxidoreductase